jgi:hypothetical protein
MKAAFTYDFRLWMLPEVIECLYEAGFKDVKVWWADVSQVRVQFMTPLLLMSRILERRQGRR